MSAAWRDKLRPASFRGAAFHVEVHESTFGRRGPLHEFPQRDIPFREDLGRAARRIDVGAFIIGPDYFDARDALLRACEESGPGKLVHPFFGELMVALVEARVTETFDEGGIARFALQFVEAGEQAQPSVTRDTGSRVKSLASRLRTATGAMFVDAFSLLRVPDFLSLAANAHLTAALDVVETMTGAVNDAAQFATQAAALRADALSLLATPDALATRFDTVVAFGARVNALVPLMDFTHHLQPIGTTPTRALLLANEEALTRLVRFSAVAQASRVVADTRFETYDDAVIARDTLNVRIADAALLEPDDALFTALMDLRGAVVADVTARAIDLPRLRVIALVDNTPAIVLAHRLYGDARRAEEIVNRNAVVHPGFMPATDAILVLNR